MKLLFAMAVGLLAPATAFAGAQVPAAPTPAELAAAEAAYNTAGANYMLHVQVCMNGQNRMSTVVAIYTAAKSAADAADAAATKAGYGAAGTAAGGMVLNSIPVLGVALSTAADATAQAVAGAAVKNDQAAHAALAQAEQAESDIASAYAACGITPTHYSFVDPSWAGYATALQQAKTNLANLQHPNSGQQPNSNPPPLNPDLPPGGQFGR